mmetsp:Transcript_13543/g.17122  ORF Transcript_13543/g.17122 Transcript_13543/m.17122 type:complete len:208 (+) Transcript_13543:1218-1841(+)
MLKVTYNVNNKGRCLLDPLLKRLDDVFCCDGGVLALAVDVDTAAVDEFTVNVKNNDIATFAGTATGSGFLNNLVLAGLVLAILILILIQLNQMNTGRNLKCLSQLRIVVNVVLDNLSMGMGILAGLVSETGEEVPPCVGGDLLVGLEAEELGECTVAEDGVARFVGEGFLLCVDAEEVLHWDVHGFSTTVLDVKFDEQSVPRRVLKG